MCRNREYLGGKDMGKHECDICGYVYDPAMGDTGAGVAAGTAFEDLPGNWACPVCGADKDQFTPHHG